MDIKKGKQPKPNGVAKMNVMAQAHRITRQVVNEAATFGNKLTYRSIFAAALRDFHKKYKEQQVMVKNNKTVGVNTHELAVGDMVNVYGVVFELTETKNWGMRGDACPETQGDCITFKTKLIYHPDFDKPEGEYPYYTFPLGWAKEYGVQGNKKARWAKLVK